MIKLLIILSWNNNDMPYNSIRFIAKDNVPAHLIFCADDIAEFVFDNPDVFRYLSDILNASSGWSCKNAEIMLEQWNKRVPGKHANGKARRELIEKFRMGMKSCNDEEEKNRLRGLIPEKLIYKIVSQKYVNSFLRQKQLYRIELGCIVEINGDPINYKCEHAYETSNDCDDNKLTVDLGVCDMKIAECAEAKVSPTAFCTKDIKYLRLLTKKMNESKISHAIYLVSTGNLGMIESRLRFLDLWNDNEFILIGKENIFDIGKYSA